MKELSTEQKAKAYDEAIEKARIWKDKSGMPKDKQGILDDIFPELAESEDERIRKALINGFNKLDKSAVWYNGITNGQILTWLEKQGQVRCTGVGKKEETGALKKMLDLEKEMITPEESLGIDSETYNKIVDDCIYGDRQNPTDEKMKEFLQTEYEKGRADVIAEIQKSWSEEDEKQLNNIMWIIEAYRKNGFNETHIQIADNSESWLKSIKDRVQPKQEWSEEDEEMLKMVIKLCEQCGNEYAYYWLKSLKDRIHPQSQWKPSDEQIYSLDRALRFYGKGTAVYDSVKELLEQLKKLKGE